MAVSIALILNQYMYTCQYVLKTRPVFKQVERVIYVLVLDCGQANHIIYIYTHTNIFKT